jgi:hypothetical protein
MLALAKPSVNVSPNHFETAHSPESYATMQRLSVAWRLYFSTSLIPHRTAQWRPRSFHTSSHLTRKVKYLGPKFRSLEVQVWFLEVRVRCLEEVKGQCTVAVKPMYFPLSKTGNLGSQRSSIPLWTHQLPLLLHRLVLLIHRQVWRPMTRIRSRIPCTTIYHTEIQYNSLLGRNNTTHDEGYNTKHTKKPKTSVEWLKWKYLRQRRQGKPGVRGGYMFRAIIRITI